VSRADLCEALGCPEPRLDDAVEQLREQFSPGTAGIVLREVGGGLTLASDPEADEAVRRLLSKPRTPPLSQAQAECLALVAYLQPVARPEIARIRGVNSDSPVATLEDRGLIEEHGRTQFGAIQYRTSALFEKLFGLESLEALPDIQTFAPSAEDEQELREKLLRAGEQRVS
jgi:segregation and condensation protein B